MQCCLPPPIRPLHTLKHPWFWDSARSPNLLGNACWLTCRAQNSLRLLCHRPRPDPCRRRHFQTEAPAFIVSVSPQATQSDTVEALSSMCSLIMLRDCDCFDANQQEPGCCAAPIATVAPNRRDHTLCGTSCTLGIAFQLASMSITPTSRHSCPHPGSSQLPALPHGRPSCDAAHMPFLASVHVCAVHTAFTAGCKNVLLRRSFFCVPSYCGFLGL